MKLFLNSIIKLRMQIFFLKNNIFTFCFGYWLIDGPNTFDFDHGIFGKTGQTNNSKNENVSSSVVSFRERHAILGRYTELSITPAVLNFSLHRISRGREGCGAFTKNWKADASYLIWVLCDLWVQKEVEVKYTLKTGPILTILCACSSHTYQICPLCNFGFAEGKDAVHVNNSSWD